MKDPVARPDGDKMSLAGALGLIPLTRRAPQQVDNGATRCTVFQALGFTSNVPFGNAHFSSRSVRPSSRGLLPRHSPGLLFFGLPGMTNFSFPVHTTLCASVGIL